MNYTNITIDGREVAMAKQSTPYNFPDFVKRLNEKIRELNLTAYATLEETYMDYGAGIAWETVIVYYKRKNSTRWSHYQALYPRQWEEIDQGIIDPNVEEVLFGQYGIRHFCED